MEALLLQSHLRHQIRVVHFLLNDIVLLHKFHYLVAVFLVKPDRSFIRHDHMQVYDFALWKFFLCSFFDLLQQLSSDSCSSTLVNHSDCHDVNCQTSRPRTAQHFPHLPPCFFFYSLISKPWILFFEFHCHWAVKFNSEQSCSDYLIFLGRVERTKTAD